MKSLLFALTLLLAGASCRAQDQTPLQIRITDVMPTADPGITPQNPFIGLDFLISAWPRPAWWGRNLVRTTFAGHEFPALKDFKAQLTATTAGHTTTLGFPYYCSSYAPRWNEALGLYTVHVRAPFEGKAWPKNTVLKFQGALPAPFETGLSGPSLPFQVEFGTLPKKGFADADLISPRPSLWVKWVHVLRVAPGAKEPFQHGGYEADIMLTGRRAKKRESVVYMARVVNEVGQNVVSKKNWAQGVLSGFGDPDHNMGDLEFADSPLEFVLYRFGWDAGLADALPTEFLQHTIEYGGREPLSITFPVQRDGVFLEGDVPARDWKIESPPPPPPSN